MSASKKPKIYIGYSLNAPNSFLDFVNKLEVKLSFDYPIIENISNDLKDPSKIYNHYLESILNCDIFIAVCDYSCVRIGCQITLAIEKYCKNTLIVCKEGSTIDNIVIGSAQINHYLANIQEYNSYDHLIEIVNEYLSKWIQHNTI
jgi:hypothetical protein